MMVEKKNLASGCLLATQEMMENCTKKNCFELYGADFMLTQDLKVLYLRLNEESNGWIHQ